MYNLLALGYGKVKDNKLIANMCRKKAENLAVSAKQLILVGSSGRHKDLGDYMEMSNTFLVKAECRWISDSLKEIPYNLAPKSIESC